MEYESSAQIVSEDGGFYRSSQGDAQSNSSGGEFITNERNQLGLGMYEETHESENPKVEEEEESEVGRGGRRSKRLRKQTEKDSSRTKNKYDGYNTQFYENENPLDSDNSSEKPKNKRKGGKMQWQIRISKEHEDVVNKQRSYIDDEERTQQKIRKRIGKEMVNQTAKEIVGSFDQGHIPMRVRSYRKRAANKADFQDVD